MYSIFKSEHEIENLEKWVQAFLLPLQIKLEHKQSFMHRTKILTIVLTLTEYLEREVFSLIDLSV